MKDILQQIAEYKSTERAQWLESVIKTSIPRWKLDLLLKWNHWIIRKLIRADVEIISETLIGDFGVSLRVVNNGKLIAERKFKSIDMDREYIRGW